MVDLDDELSAEQPHFVQNVNRLTFTPKGIALLAKCGYLPLISRDDILDKSKIDGIGKCLACLQALWMTTQVCTRLIAGLPVTLLEVMTLGHVLCAIVLYMLWWHKPRWVQEPTRLDGEWVRPICAFMFMASHVSMQNNTESGLNRQRFKRGRSEISDLAYFSSTQIKDTSNTNANYKVHEVGSFVPRKLVSAFLVTAGRFNPDIEDSATHSTIDLNKVTKTRRQLASEAINQYLAIRDLLEYPTTQDLQKYNHALKMYPDIPERFKKRPKCTWALSAQWQECGTEHLVCTASSNWPSDGLLSTTGGLLMGTVLWFSSIGFSAVHIAAWNGTFASNIEAWLWRVSSLYIAFSGILWSVLHVIAQFSKSVWWLWYDLIGEAPTRSKYLVTVLCTICGALYMFSRLYLIVESFVGLRSETAAVFVIPQWVISVPHV